MMVILLKKIEKPGEGSAHPTSGSKVEVHYTGRLVSDGSKFDSSRDRNSPFTFKLGKGEVIKGWDVGVATMLKGEQSIFRMSSDYGYGENGSGAKIPGGAALEFDVELLDWNSKEDITNGKKGIFKEVLIEKSGYEKPKDCTEVTITYKLFHNNNIIEEFTNENPLKFKLGEEQVNDGLEKCVQSMVVNEKSKFIIAKPEFGYGEKGCEEKNIPPNAELIYEIELLDMKKEKETWKMEDEEKLEYAKSKKEEGNQFFKKGKYNIAEKRYEMGLNAIKYANEWKDDEKNQAEELQILLNNNIAAIKSKTKKWKDVIKYTNDVLKINPSNVKALFRKGVAQSTLSEYEEAKKTLSKALEIDPDNKDIARELTRLKKKIIIQDKKDRQIYQKMFG